jgi:hypothetical protein
MTQKEDPDIISEVEFKRHFNDYSLVLKSIYHRKGSTVTFQLMNGNDDERTHFDLKNGDFEVLVNLLSQFSSIINEINPDIAKRKSLKIRRHETHPFEDIGDFF